MENDVFESLNDVGYTGPLTDDVAFSKAIDGGPKSLAYTKLVHILSEEIKKLCGLEETVNVMNDPEESSTFLLELSSFLKELGCPYKGLITGHMSSRLQSKEDKLLLLEYLLSELMAARMVNIEGPKDKSKSLNIVVMMQDTKKENEEKRIKNINNKPNNKEALPKRITRARAKCAEIGESSKRQANVNANATIIEEIITNPNNTTTNQKAPNIAIAESFNKKIVTNNLSLKSGVTTGTNILKDTGLSISDATISNEEESFLLQEVITNDSQKTTVPNKLTDKDLSISDTTSNTKEQEENMEITQDSTLIDNSLINAPTKESFGISDPTPKTTEQETNMEIIEESTNNENSSIIETTVANIVNDQNIKSSSNSNENNHKEIEHPKIWLNKGLQKGNQTRKNIVNYFASSDAQIRRQLADTLKCHRNQLTTIKKKQKKMQQRLNDYTKRFNSNNVAATSQTEPFNDGNTLRIDHDNDNISNFDLDQNLIRACKPRRFYTRGYKTALQLATRDNPDTHTVNRFRPCNQPGRKKVQKQDANVGTENTFDSCLAQLPSTSRDIPQKSSNASNTSTADVIILDVKEEDILEISDDETNEAINQIDMDAPALRLAIVSVKHPEQPFPRQKMRKLVNALMAAVLEAPEPMPLFRMTNFTLGVAFISCEDQYAANWIWNLSGMVVEGIQLKVVNPRHLPRVVKMLWNVKHLLNHDLTVLKLLNRSHPQLKCTEWKIMKTQVYGAWISRTVLMDKISANYVRGHNHCLHINLVGNSFFRSLPRPNRRGIRKFWRQ